MSFAAPPPLPPFLETELPFERGTYRLEEGAWAGRRLHFIDHGPRDAPAVLMLHGNPTWSFLWRRVIAALPEYRCLAPDLIGLGLSDKPRRLAEHRVEAHGEALEEWLGALGITSAALMVQDWGGPIGTYLGATHLAATGSERFTALVIANTSVLLPERPRGTAFHRFARFPGISDLVFRGFGFPQNILHRIQGDPASIRGPVARAYRWPLRRWRDRAAPLALARMVPSAPDHPSVPALRRGETWARAFGGPIALVWGTRDPILGRALKWHERAFPQAAVTRTEAGHFLQEEVPEELAEALRRGT
ncbi:MAG: alpha/beta fold hydrolase [Acidobacteriota bacterium]